MLRTTNPGQTLCSALFRAIQPRMSRHCRRSIALLTALCAMLLLATPLHAKRLPSDWTASQCSPSLPLSRPRFTLPSNDLINVELPNGWTPRPYQRNAWRYLQAGGKHCELIWHRRAGKDDLSLHWTAVAANDIGHKDSIGRVGNYWHMLPQANQARKALWDAINPHTGKRRVDEAFPPAIRAGTLEHEMVIRCKSGSSWQVVGSDNFNSLVGSPPIGLVFSEWPLCNPAAWAYLMPILEENGGWAIFNGTPRGRNHAYRSVMGAIKSPTAFGEILSAHHTGIFTDEQLARVRLELQETYGEEYGNSVYEQEYEVSFDAANLGAILARQITRARAEGRVDDVRGAYDPAGAKIQISSDIGRRDASSWWFWQPCVGGLRVSDYDKDSGMDADEWCERLQKRITENGYEVGTVWLPHDAKAKTFAAKHSAVEIFIQHFGANRVRIVPDSSREDRINAARRVATRTAWHATNCEKGLEGLTAWSYVYDEERKEFSREPDHNWASHDGDGFSYGALVLEEAIVEARKDEPMRGLMVGVPSVPLEEMWKDRPRRQDRI